MVYELFYYTKYSIDSITHIHAHIVTPWLPRLSQGCNIVETICDRKKMKTFKALNFNDMPKLDGNGLICFAYVHVHVCVHVYMHTHTVLLTTRL